MIQIKGMRQLFLVAVIINVSAGSVVLATDVGPNTSERAGEAHAYMIGAAGLLTIVSIVLLVTGCKLSPWIKGPVYIGTVAAICALPFLNAED